jgi:hypothetical protein
MPTLRITTEATKAELERAMTALRTGRVRVEGDDGKRVSLDELLEAWAKVGQRV